MSPQNEIVGADGIGRIVDFGVAKALGRMQMTRDGALKGKLAYMAPEQLSGRSLDRRADLYSAGVVLWETLTGQRLFQGDSEGQLLGKVLEMVVAPPSQVNASVPAALDDVTMRALARNPAVRYATADEMALALESTGARASASAVAAWVKERAGHALRGRAQLLARMESGATAHERSGVARRPSIADVATERVRFVRPEVSVPDIVVAVPDVRPTRATRRRAWGIAAVIAAAALLAWLVVRATVAKDPARAVSTAESVPRSPLDPSEAAIPSAAASSVSSSPLASPSLTPSAAPAEPASTSTSSARARAAPPRASPSAEPKWCKVFDPTKRIFVVKPMNVARCP